jgi:DNA-directed RNA polymerase specialized sigma24 family protein
MANDTADDAQIVRAFADDPQEGVWQLLSAHGGRARQALRRRFGPTLDEHELEIALYDGALKALRTFDPARRSLGGWYLFLADREAINRLRRELPHRERTVPLGERDFVDPRGTPESELDLGETLRLLRDAIQRQLSEVERAVVLADLDAGGMANAACLAGSLKTTRYSIYAARTRARAKLQDALASVFQPPKGR